jgi:hypothetical protein
MSPNKHGKREELPEERWARQVIETHLGLPTTWHDDGSNDKMPDALIHRGDTLVPVETITDNDDKHLSQRSALAKRGRVIKAPGIGRGWWMTIEAHADIRRLRSKLPALVGDPNTWQPPYPLSDEHAYEGVPDPIRALGVIHMVRVDEEDTIVLATEGRVSWKDVIDLPSWIERVLTTQNDVKPKLQGFESPEAHAFIWATFTSSMSINRELRELASHPVPLSYRPPVLPEGITDVWVGSTWTSRGCVHWSTATGWEQTAWVTTADLETELPKGE